MRGPVLKSLTSTVQADAIATQPASGAVRVPERRVKTGTRQVLTDSRLWRSALAARPAHAGLHIYRTEQNKVDLQAGQAGDSG
jgi:hypothetical protein